MITRFLTAHGLRAALLLGSLGTLTLGANAQSLIARANVPFEFAAGGAMMAPGQYTVEVTDLSGVILLHGAAGNSVALLSTFSGAVSGSANARLIFAKRDGIAYLSAVELPDQTAQVLSVFKPVTKGVVAAALH
jgi:hypothetical protein